MTICSHTQLTFLVRQSTASTTLHSAHSRLQCLHLTVCAAASQQHTTLSWPALLQGEVPALLGANYRIIALFMIGQKNRVLRYTERDNRCTPRRMILQKLVKLPAGLPSCPSMSPLEVPWLTCLPP